MRLQEGQIFGNAGMTDLGLLAGDKSINFYLIKMKLGIDTVAFHLDCDGKNSHFDAYPDVCKPRANGVDWDLTIFPTEELARARAREILSIEYPSMNCSAL